MKCLITILLLFATPILAAPLALYSPAVVDSVSGDTLQPALAHTIAYDTTTAADTAGWSISTYTKIHRWPDSLAVRMFGINPAMMWGQLAGFAPDSIDGRRVWWSGAIMLEDSVITPGQYEVRGDSLVLPGGT